VVQAPIRILVVDDDSNVSDVVATYLRRAGMDVEVVADGVTALAALRRTRPDLVVLDLMLPGMSGLEVCVRLRESHPTLPVVMLTALGEESDRIAGLELGADDYVVKPFSPQELLLRVQSVLRRGGAFPAVGGRPRRVVSGPLEIDVTARTASLRGVRLVLTAREFELLVHFVTHPGEAFSRERLMRDVWGWGFGDTSTVTVHVRRLREKVEDDPASPARIVTIWGVGYRWEPV
jgi:two-component system, OmpR family, response regulator ResD